MPIFLFIFVFSIAHGTVVDNECFPKGESRSQMHVEHETFDYNGCSYHLEENYVCVDPLRKLLQPKSL